MVDKFIDFLNHRIVIAVTVMIFWGLSLMGLFKSDYVYVNVGTNLEESKYLGQDSMEVDYSLEKDTLDE